MTHIPRAFCSNCGIEMKPLRNGVQLQVLTANRMEYYKIHSDRWGCPQCNNAIYIGFGSPIHPRSEHYEDCKVHATVRTRN